MGEARRVRRRARRGRLLRPGLRARAGPDRDGRRRPGRGGRSRRDGQCGRGRGLRGVLGRHRERATPPQRVRAARPPLDARRDRGLRRHVRRLAPAPASRRWRRRRRRRRRLGARAGVRPERARPALRVRRGLRRRRALRALRAQRLLHRRPAPRRRRPSSTDRASVCRCCSALVVVDRALRGGVFFADHVARALLFCAWAWGPTSRGRRPQKAAAF
mmetsp:Transcript_7597/g.31458  ORF Transcript_7597/g.31458 Transcript_7597/m.31458 type:complete len:217 (-) Transcript_7597:39-689(-)